MDIQKFKMNRDNRCLIRRVIISQSKNRLATDTHKPFESAGLDGIISAVLWHVTAQW
jgi:hypothetical protein